MRFRVSSASGRVFCAGAAAASDVASEFSELLEPEPVEPEFLEPAPIEPADFAPAVLELADLVVEEATGSVVRDLSFHCQGRESIRVRVDPTHLGLTFSMRQYRAMSASLKLKAVCGF